MTPHALDIDGTAPTRLSWLARSILLIGLGLLAYHNAFDGPFLFDDWTNIVELQTRPASELWSLRSFLTTNRPLVQYSFAAQLALSGQDVRAFHAVNVSLHLLNALLVVAVVSSFLSQPRWTAKVTPMTAQQLSFAVAAIWVVHPLTTQAVTYMAQRYEAAMTACFLGCAWTALRSWLSSRTSFWLTISVSCCWLGFLCKEVMAAAPLVVPLVDRAATGRAWRELIRRRAWFYLALWSPWLWMFRTFLQTAVTSHSAGFAYQKVTAWEYLATQPEILWHYLRLAGWSVELCLDYDWPVQQQTWISLSLGLPLALICLYGFAQALRGSWGGLLVAAFFLILTPTSSILPIADLANEHRMYLPLVCVVAGGVVVVWQLGNAAASRFRISPIHCAFASSVIGIALVAGLTWRTIQRNEEYRSAARIWSGALHVNPQNSRAWYNLATEYVKAGDLDRALSHYQAGLNCRSPVPELHYGVAECLRRQGQWDAAEAAFQKALSVLPNHSHTHFGLGLLHQQRGRYEAAIAEFERAATAGSTVAAYNAASLKIELGRHQEAIGELRRIVKLHPNFAAARHRLAAVLTTTTESPPQE